MSYKKPQNLSSKSVLKMYVYAGSVGLSYCFEVLVGGLVGYFVGNWVDNRFSLSPWGVVLSVVLLISLTVWHMVVGLQNLQKKMDSFLKGEESKNES
jgi:F0F1-type ATP synthase assembly protein I